MDNPDIVVIGGGIAGGAMATVLARAGRSVVLLEITKEHRDIVRGEFVAPWGVAELQRLELYKTLMSKGGHHITSLTFYDEIIDPAHAGAQDLTKAVPGVPAALAIGHPRCCTALDGAAVEAGTQFLRGVRHTRVTPGARPTVAFEHDGVKHELSPRLVIAADGRHGQTRKQAGIPLREDAQHNWLSGLLVEGADAWPAERAFGSTEGRSNVFCFPQGGGFARLYLNVALEDRTRVMGREGRENFLASFRLKSVPDLGALAEARPAGDIFVYPNQDTWTDEPFTEGVVLIGDAAGHNDPVIGQGLSIAYRDVRIVSDILKGPDWSARTFKPYAEERAERMRRLRLIASTIARRDVEFDEAARERRRRAHKTMSARPELGLFFAPLAIGPDAVPPEIFSNTVVAAVSGD